MNPDVKVSELCDLIRACGESGVTDLSFGTLHVQFTPGTTRATSSQAHEGLDVFQDVQPKQDSEEKEAIEAEEIKLRDEQMAMALLENPAEFEKLLVAGELDG